ncbi:enediyne biosynthesis protein UnbU [Actinoplanes aureus]|uniref:Enediyne biosynthesis protein UnbU n=1 Tax=Actinoplanes aureus TaxID=2792083 RepID=A0A931CJI8_9ACTN|nr:enediyne biosynthesis protein UnbU [Actinoplanes aureus]MBG0566095.1 enediyne biosynthesis protein UnbU [Actinoplanes aureus]
MTSPTRSPKGLTALRRFAVSITVFTILGHVWLGFEQSYLTPIVALLTAYALSLLLESVDAWAQHRPVRFRGSTGNLVTFLLPAHIAALACAMLLYGNERLMPTVFAVTVAISSKYLLRIRVGGVPRHYFNPSNLGISATLICFTWVAIAPPYQFTENTGSIVDWALPAVILISGTVINAKLTGRMPLILGWVGGFALQAVIRGAFLPDSLASALLVMTGVAFILFTNYMITDPQTSPSRPRDQVLFGAATAGVYGLLVTAHITFGLFYALTIVCAGRFLFTLVRTRRAGDGRTAPSRPPTTPARTPEAVNVGS